MSTSDQVPSPSGSRAVVPPLTFFFPYHDVSGVPMLFSRMAVHLAGCGVDVRVVDYEDGAMAERVRGVSGVRLIPFRDGQALTIGPESVLVMQSILPATLRPELRIDRATRLLFWTLHPACFIQTVIPTPYLRDLQMRSRAYHRLASAVLLGRYSRRLRRFVEALHRRHALLFMDGETLRLTSERVGLRIEDPVFVPVPSDAVSGDGASPRGGGEDGVLRFAWLGRLADFKIHILVHTLEQLSRIARERRMKITALVVGDGPDAAMIRPSALEHEHFAIEMLGVIKGAALDEFLKEQVDLLGAMGTSALEGARLGVPTLLLDIAYGPVPGSYAFRWLHETKQFTLGEVIRTERTAPGNRSLEEKVDDVMRDRPALSRAAFGYYRAHHAIPTVAERFLDSATRSEFTYGEIDEYLLRKSLIRRIYEWMRRLRAERGSKTEAY